MPDDAFESALRDRERAEVPKRIEARGSGCRSRRNVVSAATRAVAVPAVGDLLNLNVNAIDFCTNPDITHGSRRGSVRPGDRRERHGKSAGWFLRRASIGRSR